MHNSIEVFRNWQAKASNRLILFALDVYSSEIGMFSYQTTFFETVYSYATIINREKLQRL